MPKFDQEVYIDLDGPDGNAFAILGLMRTELKIAGATPAELEQFRNEATAGDYENLLKVCREWVVFNED